MFKHILVPLDGSKRLEQAIPYALNIANSDTKITLIYALKRPIIPFPISPSPPTFPIETEDYATLRINKFEQAEAYLNKVCLSFQDQASILETHLIMGGNPANEIIDFGNNHAVDVIVIAAQDYSKIFPWFRGSLTQKILQTATCPVFVIPTA